MYFVSTVSASASEYRASEFFFGRLAWLGSVLRHNSLTVVSIVSNHL
jgi:hypothetical protein